MDKKRFSGSEGRAARELRQDLAAIDLVVELLDARAPSASQNPRIGRLTAGKQRLILLHKADRSEPRVTSRWVNYFKDKGYSAMTFSIHQPHRRRVLFKYLQDCRAGLSPAHGRRSLRIMVVGIPNVGKSSLINYLVRQRAARSGNRPGITRGRQWIRLLPGVELLDTPGVLYPRLSGEVIPLLVAIGSLPSAAIEAISTAGWLLGFYRETGRAGLLAKRYPGLGSSGDPDLQLEEIGRVQGCLLPGGKIDLQRAAETVLRDFQNGNLGNVSLEYPPGMEDK
ncbi:MAG: ribosome biogenesis GTPase YlqF [Firmicutes bacterium]|nr:ribosome biogenesis GTPase YlqF [Bacillota bacterium]